MIVGIGIDIVAVERFARRIPEEPGLKEDLFTEHEIAYCQEKSRFAECYAARFAAKEAFLKAIGTGWRDGIVFRQVEVLTTEMGKPELRLSDQAAKAANALGVRTVHVSISHESTHAVAVVVLES
jgi:holo-[acyl-carrier protein] synthase